MTIKDIARLAGVSISTVSKIIHGKDEHIKPETRMKVLQIVKEYNFVPYASNKNASSTKKYLIGVLLRSVHKTALVLQGILRTAQNHGYGVLLLDSEDDPTREAKHITTLCKNGVDAVIWEPVSSESYEYSLEFEKMEIPYYFINDPGHVSNYLIDYAKIGYFLAQCLIQKNHTNILCVFPKDDKYSELFLNGFQQCLYDYQIPFTNDMVLRAPCENLVEHLILKNISGIICTDFKTTLAINKILKNKHYHIPSDFSLVTLIDHPYDISLSRLISCMPVPSCEFGTYLCEQIIRVCEKTENVETSYLFQPDCQLNHERSLDYPASMNTKKIISIGSIHKDLTFRVDHLPQLGHTLKIHNTTTTIGGKGANQAIGIAKLGLPVCLIAAIGDDFDSTFVLNTLERENISTQGICRIPGSQTGKAYIYTENSGESAITILSGANEQLTASDIKNNRYLFRNSQYCMISDEVPLEVILVASQIAKANHITTVFKPSVLEKLPDPFFQTIDILIPNRKEAAILCPEYTSVEDQAEYFFNKGIPVVIITLGHEGCYLKTADTSRYFPAIDWPAVDTTGGADAFISTLVSYLYKGYPLEKAIQIANISAGFCILRQGVSSALIDKNSLELYIAKTSPDLL